MLFYLLVLFIGLPVLELSLLLRVHEHVGLGPTLALVVGTGILGATLAKLQGARVLTRIQADLAEGRMPAPHLLDGLLILLAGAVLVTPGLVTDTVGFLLLIPATRKIFKKALRTWLEKKVTRGQVHTVTW